VAQIGGALTTQLGWCGVGVAAAPVGLDYRTGAGVRAARGLSRKRGETLDRLPASVGGFQFQPSEFAAGGRLCWRGMARGSNVDAGIWRGLVARHWVTVVLMLIA
jgi:hypothetical protein